MGEIKLDTYAKKTWCPGCTNFAVLAAFKNAIKELIEEGFAEKKDFVITTGIGCHGKMFDYLDLNGYYGLHGRALSLAIGIKLGNSKLHPITFAGDGDMYAEGLDHFTHACRSNPDVTLIVHNNQVFALTTGQHTPTTEKGFKSKSLGRVTFEKPLNPIALALISGCTFVARGFALDINHLKYLIKEAIRHKGFGFIDVLQPCITFHNTIDYFRKRVYKLEEIGHNYRSFDEALEKALEWNYQLDENAKIAIGIFYKEERETLEESLNCKEWYKIRRILNIDVLDMFKI